MPPASSAETGLFAAFCAAGLWPGLGRTTAGRLAEAGITRPADVTIAKLCDVQGVSPMRADRLAGNFRDRSLSYDIAELLYAAELPLRPAAAAAAALGRDAVSILRDDPWRLLDGGDCDLAAADQLAASLGVPRDAPGRGPAVVVDLLERAARAGDTAADQEALLSAVARQQVASPADALQAAAGGGRVDIDTEDDSVALERLAVAETSVAEGLVRLIATAEKVSADDFAVDPDSGLDDRQAAAAVLALTTGVSVLTGGPGHRQEPDRLGDRRAVRKAAGCRSRWPRRPAGRPSGWRSWPAAPATTIHRLLGAQPVSDRTGGPRCSPATTTGRSTPTSSWSTRRRMLDVELAAALVEACATAPTW